MTLNLLAIGAARVVVAIPRWATLLNASYLGVLTAAASRPSVGGNSRKRPVRASGSALGSAPGSAHESLTTFGILVPAHNEELLIEETVESLIGTDYDPALVSVYVVADHCDDDTARLARIAGATVFEHRGAVRGKGPALNWLLSELRELPDVLLVVDADTTVSANILERIAYRMDAGADIVQVSYEVRNPHSSDAVAIRSAAFAVRHYLRPMGRSELGLSAGLFGNGMAFRSDVLATHPWSGHLTEDIDMHLSILRSGLCCEFEPAATVQAEMPDTADAARTQNLRWEQGRLDMARSSIARLGGDLKGKSLPERVRLVEATLDQLSPPFSIAVLASASGLGVSVLFRVVFGPAVAIRRSWVFALGVYGAALGSALHLSGAPRSVWLALVHAPSAIVWKARIYWDSLTGRSRASWTRTTRNQPNLSSKAQANELVEVDTSCRPDSRLPISLLGGLSIDRVTMSETVDKIAGFVEESRLSGRLFQVATVNTDYLANARHDLALERLLQRMDLLTADGMPLLWASRRHRAPIPERVAGADLVPLLAARCASEGYRVFLIGGAPGVATQAASLLKAVNPDLIIQGCSCSYFDSLDDMDVAVLDKVRDFEPDIVLVALGHPKQEWWGQRFGPELRSGVVIGIGGSLDFLTGTTTRAPAWMRGIGLEWAHRLAHSPRRLAPRYLRDFVEFPRFVRSTGEVVLSPDECELASNRSDSLAGGRLSDAGVDVISPSGSGHGLSGSFDADTGAVSTLVVDLSLLGRLDRHGVTSLVNEARQRQDRGLQTYVCGGGDEVRGFLEKLRVDKYLNYRSSLGDVASLLLEDGR